MAAYQLGRGKLTIDEAIGGFGTFTEE